MEQSWPIGLQVALYAIAAAMVAIAVVLVSVLLKIQKQLERVVEAVEHAEAELTPLAREARIVVYRLGNLTDKTQRIVDRASGAILQPVTLVRRAVHIARSGVTAFFQTLRTGRPHAGRT